MWRAVRATGFEDRAHEIYAHRVGLWTAEFPHVRSCRSHVTCAGISRDLRLPCHTYKYSLAHVPRFLVKSTPVNGAPLFVDLCSLSSLFSFSLCLISRTQVRAPLSFRFSPFVPCSRATAPGAVTPSQDINHEVAIVASIFIDQEIMK